MGQLFLEDLAATWRELGATALRRCAQEEPAQFVRVIASLLPREAVLDVSVGVNLADVTDTLQLYRKMAELLGANPKPGLRQLKRAEIIDADPV